MMAYLSVPAQYAKRYGSKNMQTALGIAVKAPLILLQR